MSSKERDDRFDKIDAAIDDELAQMLAMVVMAVVNEDPAHLKELLQLLKALPAPRALRHDEPVGHLITGLVALPARSRRLPNEADGEAPFSIYKT
jgi:hypothetical protein